MVCKKHTKWQSFKHWNWSVGWFLTQLKHAGKYVHVDWRQWRRAVHAGILIVGEIENFNTETWNKKSLGTHFSKLNWCSRLFSRLRMRNNTSKRPMLKGIMGGKIEASQALCSCQVWDKKATQEIGWFHFFHLRDKLSGIPWYSGVEPCVPL